MLQASDRFGAGRRGDDAGRPRLRKSGDVAAGAAVIARAGDRIDAGRGSAARILQGLDTGLAASAGRWTRRWARRAAARRSRRGRSRFRGSPRSWPRLATTTDETGATAKRVVAKLDWPGKPAPVVTTAVPLTAEQQQRYDAGAELYKSICIGCHQPDGKGKEKIAPSLVESRYVNGPDAAPPTRILLAGKEGAIGLMPPLGGALNDEQIASVLTYIRREWGHTASPVAPDDVRRSAG